MTNVTNRVCHVEILLNGLEIEEKNWFDLLAEKEWPASGKKLLVELQPYDVIWLTPNKILNPRGGVRGVITANMSY